MSATMATAMYAMKTRVSHALLIHMMAATNPSRMMVPMTSFRVSIRTYHLAFPSHSSPRNLQHFVQYPLYSHSSFVVSFFRQCLHRVGSRWASALITLICILQSFLSVLVRQHRVDFPLAVIARHFRIPFLQRHIAPAVQALMKQSDTHIIPPLRVEGCSDADSGRPCRKASSRRRSGIRTRLGRFSCRVSA